MGKRPAKNYRTDLSSSGSVFKNDKTIKLDKQERLAIKILVTSRLRQKGLNRGFADALNSIFIKLTGKNHPEYEKNIDSYK